MSINGKLIGNAILGLFGVACLILGAADAGARGAIIVGLLFAAVAGMNIAKLLQMKRESGGGLLPRSGSTGGSQKYSILDLDRKVLDIGDQLIGEVPSDWKHFNFFIERNGASAYSCRVEGPGGAPFRPSYTTQRIVLELNKIIYDLNRHTRLLCSARQNDDGTWNVKMSPEDRV